MWLHKKFTGSLDLVLVIDYLKRESLPCIIGGVRVNIRSDLEGAAILLLLSSSVIKKAKTEFWKGYYFHLGKEVKSKHCLYRF